MSAPTCPACDAPIAPGAAACPSCGVAFGSGASAPSSRPPRWLWVVLGVVVGCPSLTVLLGVLVTVFAPGVLHRARAAAEHAARRDLDAIARALDEYAARHEGRFPDALDALVEPDATGARCLDAPRVPKDPWKHAYRYEPPRAPGEPRPRVWSYGVDGAPGGGDDLDSRATRDG